MKWLKSWLVQPENKTFTFEEFFAFEPSLIKSTKYLLDLKDLKVEGQGRYDLASEVLSLEVDVSGTMVVPCALSLEPVDYPFQSYGSMQFTFDKNNEDDEIIVVKGVEIDIIPFVWELISLEIPFKVIKEGAQYKTQGKDWEFISAEEDQTREKIDPRLAKLKDLFKE